MPLDYKCKKGGGREGKGEKEGEERHRENIYSRSPSLVKIVRIPYKMCTHSISLSSLGLKFVSVETI